VKDSDLGRSSTSLGQMEQCRSYSRAFNYVVLIADRHRVTLSPYFGKFKREGVGVWRHSGADFYSIILPKRREVTRQARMVVYRQFRRLRSSTNQDRNILEWL
jgi:hypothetical protein